MSDTDFNFALLVDATCEREPTRPALFYRDQAIAYGDLARRIDACAAALHARGAGPGRSVAVWLTNCPAFVTAFFGALRLGATIAPLGALLRPREVRERLQIAESAVLVTTAALGRELGEASVGVLEVDPSGADLPEARSELPVRRAPDDVAVLVFTSGTTGTAKAAEVTHGGIRWNTRAIVDSFALARDDVQLAAAPLSHVLGMTGIMSGTLVSGGAIALMDRFDPVAALALMTLTGTSGAMGAPPMFASLLREARKVGGAPRLRFAHSGGAALSSELARSVEETFGCLVREGYGMSEVGGAITGTAIAAEPKPGSVGRAFAGSELRVVDLVTRACLPSGERGEVQVRSPSVMRGYRGDPQATRAVIDPDGWLSTGDIGYVDDDGDLFLVGRKKELIIRSGYNVYPPEVEEAILACPGVLEVAVVGVPHDEHGEEVVALVVPAEDGLDPEKVKAFARERVAAYKYPRHVVLVEDLPKGPTGKISKLQIDREALLALLPPAYASTLTTRPGRT